MTRLALPIGESSFRSIRNWDFYYVDKTPYIWNLVRRPGYYFLSRPRRFGKTLLLDTMHELFEGNEELFRDLHIHDRWDWNTKHPVVRLSFGGGYNEPGNLESSIISQLSTIEKYAGFELSSSTTTGSDRFRELVLGLYHHTGKQVVVLVDEYDKPILDVLGDMTLARANQDHLHGFYSIIKDCARYIRFVFVTGVSMFSKVNLFSGLNNLNDISLNSQYATICGYTDADIDTVFTPELEGLDRNEIRRWYNGYNWRGEEKVYNPFDILLLFNTKEFEPYWYETGSPKFLFRQLMKKEISPLELEKRVVDKSRVSKFDVGDIGVEALLFQTGYLTIVSEERVGTKTSFTLGYPNYEVRQSLNNGLLDHLGKSWSEVSSSGMKLCELLVKNEFERFGEQLRWYLSGIPYQWYNSDTLARYEAWYAGLLYSCFQTIGVDIRVEDASSRGRADLVVLHGGQVFVLELKVAAIDSEVAKKLEEAMAQIRKRGYADKYRIRGEEIHHIAVVFSRTERNLVAIRTEKA